MPRTRVAIAIGLVMAMIAFGAGVYEVAGMLRAGRHSVHKPTEVSAPSLPGTMYVAQEGAIYRFQHGSFVALTSESGWMQPSAAPNNQLVVVRRQGNFSDLYLLSTSGKTVAQLSHNSSPQVVEGNHWTFYPRYSPDGRSLFYDFDPKDYYDSYRVDLAIFVSPIGSGGNAQKWTTPNDFTGGDVQPVPLRDGGLVYTKYSIDDSFQVHSQIWIQRRAGSAGQALTAPETGCASPAVSPDEKLIVMICNKGSNQSAELDIATFDAANLTLGSPATLVSGRLVASPTFSPDGKTVAFLAPDTPGGRFQLWTVGSSGPTSLHEITSDLSLDSTSAPVWLAR
jgi:Tol biopolymer transport system component